MSKDFDFNDDVYLFYSVISDTEKFDENVYYLKLLYHFHDYEKEFYLSISSDEADFIHSMILEFRALILGLKSISDIVEVKK